MYNGYKYFKIIDIPKYSLVSISYEDNNLNNSYKYKILNYYNRFNNSMAFQHIFKFK